ncbi:MAG: hypothetical protein IJA09_02865 [Bacteroidales bacterium]|nr:hypothetical protein [Bacteroidales bacterium]
MKKIFTLLVMLISLFTTSEIIASNNQVVAKSTGCTSINGKGVATFVVTSPQAQVCDLSFLMMPGEYADGSFTSVTLKVNGVTLPNLITFSTYGWQSANTTGNAVSLSKGDNTVQFISGRDDVPMVKNVAKKNINTLTNQNQNFISSTFASVNNLQRTISSGNSYVLSGGNGVIPYSYIDTVCYSYTSCIPITLPTKQILTLYAPTANDPMFGPDESTIDFNLYIFSDSTIVDRFGCDSLYYSESVSSNNKYVYWQSDSLNAGNYNILIEAKNGGEIGGVTLRVNTTLYRYNFASNTTFPCAQQGSATYFGEDNIFTTDLRTSNNAYSEANPILWLKEFDSEQSKYKIIAYNDDYNTSYISDFNWNKNARIRRTLDKTKGDIYTVLITSANVDYNNQDTCKLYLSNLYTRNYEGGYPLLREGDAIISSSHINIRDYNCYAWSAGCTTQRISPSINSFLWFDSLYNNDIVHTKLGVFERDRNLPKLVFNGRDPTNAVIALWEDSGEIKHASIKKNNFSVAPHGYDWESKMADGHRIFHPKDALGSDGTTIGYGRIIAYYKVADDRVAKSNYAINANSQYISDEELIVEDIVLTENDINIIDSNIYSINQTKEDEFNLLYKNWKDFIKTNPYENDMWNFKNTTQYNDLLSCMRGIENGEYLAYRKIVDNDIFAILLIQDYANSSSLAKQEWNKIFYNRDPQVLGMSQSSKINAFIKKIVTLKNSDSALEVISNNTNLHVATSSNTITINIDIEETSTYRIEVVDLNSNYIRTVVPEIRVQAGEYEHSINVPNGNYVVVYYLNGNINSKKVSVK